MYLCLYLPSQSKDQSNVSWYCCCLNVVLVGYSSLKIKISLFVFYSSNIISELCSSTVFCLVSTQFLVTVPRFLLFDNYILWWWIISNFNSGWSFEKTIWYFFVLWQMIFYDSSLQKKVLMKIMNWFYELFDYLHKKSSGGVLLKRCS